MFKNLFKCLKRNFPTVNEVKLSYFKLSFISIAQSLAIQQYDAFMVLPF